MNRTFYTVRITANGHCRYCRCERQIYRRSLNHMFQLIVTLVTLGLWAIPWLAMWCAACAALGGAGLAARWWKIP